MSPERALSLVTVATMLAGIGAIWAAGFIGLPGVLLTVLGVVVAGGLRERVVSSSAFVRALGVAVAGFGLLDVLYLAERVFDGLVRLLIFLVILRLGTARRPREFRDAGLLAFFMLVASAAVSFGPGFFVALVAFLTAGTALLVLAHDLSEAERLGGARAAPRAIGRGLLTLSLGATAGSLAVTLALFFVIPRLGEATLALRSPVSRMLIGFSDRVDIGDIGELEDDPTVAMRVQLTGPPPPELFGELRWRGVVLDRFDGRTWSVSPRRRVGVFRGPGAVDVGNAGGRLLSQEVYLEPIGTTTLFAAPRAVRASRRGDLILIDDMGVMLLPAPVNQLRYTVDSVVAARYPERLDGVARRRYLQLPPMKPRIAALAGEIASGADPATAAQALTDYLRREFTYSLRLERSTALDPLEEFLFVRRSGNCEYFASALTVMLRSLGIPARVAAGFQRGEWNPFGGYFLVRMSDAHAWVEAYIDEAGWITLDPSPRTEVSGAGPWRGAGLYLDALRLQWHRYIVNWSRQDQVRAAATLRRAATAWRPELGAWDWRGYEKWALAAVMLAAVVVTWRRWKRTWPQGRARPAQIPAFYRRALRILARRALTPRPGETAREFSARVAATDSAWRESIENITASYESVRFGEVALRPDQAAEIRGWVRDLHRPGSGLIAGSSRGRL
jgi:transglutaminase-like putative cysteine protease